MILMNEYNSAVSLCVFGLGFTVWFSVWYPGWGFLLTLGFVYRVGLRVLGVCFSDLVEFVIRVSFGLVLLPGDRLRAQQNFQCPVCHAHT